MGGFALPGPEIAPRGGPEGLEKPPPVVHIRHRVHHPERDPEVLRAERPSIRAMADKPDGSTLTKPSETQAKPPPMYQVVMYNDDYTPMEFVVEVLQVFFALSRERATQIMLKVHTEGRGICGIYPKDVASSKVEQVTEYSRQHQHPLQCAMEET
jgi:ATP-dependent Clp protease adaptor protein ClpS